MSDNLKQAGPYGTSWENGYCVLRYANAPEGMRILMMTPDNIEWVASRMNKAYEAARAKGAEEIAKWKGIVKGVHGALNDIGTVPVPPLDADLYDAVMAIRAKDQELIQQLVDAGNTMRQWLDLTLQMNGESCPDCKYDWGNEHNAGCYQQRHLEAIEAWDAAAQGFKPSDE